MTKMLKPLVLSLIAAAGSAAAADRITFYSDEQFGGRQFSADQPISDFIRYGLNNRVNSAVVHDGRWEICIDTDYRGGCGILGPGAYPNLGAYANRISSVRPVDGRYSDARVYDGRVYDGRVYDGRVYDGRRYPDRPDYPGPARHGDARATLYEGPNLSGRAFPLNDAVMNLGRTGFNDRASSLRVDSGYWIFCSDSEFRGECRTFGPGDYASLPGLNNVISSGRRISNFYPYGDRPDWREPYPSQGALNRR